MVVLAPDPNRKIAALVYYPQTFAIVVIKH